jgi:hypothetical protein
MYIKIKYIVFFCWNTRISILDCSKKLFVTDYPLIIFWCSLHAFLMKASLGYSYICNTSINKYFSATVKLVCQTVEDIIHNFQVAVAIYIYIYILFPYWYLNDRCKTPSVTTNSKFESPTVVLACTDSERNSAVRRWQKKLHLMLINARVLRHKVVYRPSQQ